MLQIDADFPGGNIIVEGQDGPSFRLRQDWSSSTEWWFYWHFRVRGAAGQTLRFRFTDGDVFSAGGPCFSADGINWQWLGRTVVRQDEDSLWFEHTIAADCATVFFSFCIPYVENHLRAFLQHEAVQWGALTHSEKGRRVELLHLPSVSGTHKVPIIARSHACEAMANYVIEGIIAYWLNSNEAPADFLREHVDLWIVPFLDKDGVEEGDQGKFRAPHDHNRDYTAQPRYASTRALMQEVHQWRGELALSLDIHCPWIRDGINEQLATVGLAQPWQARLDCFTAHLEQSQSGTLKFRADSYTPYGHEWNQGKGHSFNRYMNEAYPDRLSAAFEIPYAVTGGQTMTVQGARVFGQDVGRALALYIQQQNL